MKPNRSNVPSGRCPPIHNSTSIAFWTCTRTSASGGLQLGGKNNTNSDTAIYLLPAFEFGVGAILLELKPFERNDGLSMKRFHLQAIPKLTSVKVACDAFHQG
jgi:hypothetical protein